MYTYVKNFNEEMNSHYNKSREQNDTVTTSYRADNELKRSFGELEATEKFR